MKSLQEPILEEVPVDEPMPRVDSATPSTADKPAPADEGGASSQPNALSEAAVAATQGAVAAAAVAAMAAMVTLNAEHSTGDSSAEPLVTKSDAPRNANGTTAQRSPVAGRSAARVRLFPGPSPWPKWQPQAARPDDTTSHEEGTDVPADDMDGVNDMDVMSLGEERRRMKEAGGMAGLPTASANPSAAAANPPHTDAHADDSASDGGVEVDVGGGDEAPESPPLIVDDEARGVGGKSLLEAERPLLPASKKKAESPPLKRKGMRQGKVWRPVSLLQAAYEQRTMKYVSVLLYSHCTHFVLMFNASLCESITITLIELHTWYLCSIRMRRCSRKAGNLSKHHEVTLWDWPIPRQTPQ